MIFWHFTYYFTFSFLSKQSEPFKAAFLGTTRDNEQSRFKRQLQSAEVDDTAIEDNAEIEEEGSTQPPQEIEANSEQGEENVDTLLTAEGDDAINCNWNIKVNKICTFKIFYHIMSAPMAIPKMYVENPLLIFFRLSLIFIY